MIDDDALWDEIAAFIINGPKDDVEDETPDEPEREKGDDDGQEYADPRDEREDRLRDW